MSAITTLYVTIHYDFQLVVHFLCPMWPCMNANTWKTVRCFKESVENWKSLNSLSSIFYSNPKERRGWMAINNRKVTFKISCPTKSCCWQQVFLIGQLYSRGFQCCESFQCLWRCDNMSIMLMTLSSMHWCHQVAEVYWNLSKLLPIVQQSQKWWSSVMQLKWNMHLALHNTYHC